MSTHRFVPELFVVLSLWGLLSTIETAFAQEPVARGIDSVQLAWTQHYASGGGTYDEFRDMAIDQSGNVYVTGSTFGPATQRDYATIKYDPSGAELWVRRYSNTTQFNDIPAAIAVDNEGNVYVTGSSDDSTGVGDYATIKYDPSGQQLWVARYNGPGDDSDEALALALDSQGNAYVTGSTYDPGSGAGTNYATIKYDPSGNELWVSEYNGTGNGGDVATALAVDQSGNVHVTGFSAGSLGYTEFATVKYDSLGQELWASRYRFPVTPSSDFARKIVVDATGNVYVTGESYGGPGQSLDFATVKYNSNGNEQWVMRYDSGIDGADYPKALTVDNDGSVIVTGWSGQNNYDYATIKYTSLGNEEWIAFYEGPVSNGTDRATDVAVDATGNVFVTGWSDAAGGYDQFATVKYDNSGGQLWVARHGTGGYNRPTSVAVGQNGKVYVAGQVDRSDNHATYADWDFAAIQYNSAGIEDWKSFYRGWYNSVAYGRSIAADGAGGAYVTGWSKTEVGTEDYTTIKYGSRGVEEWIRRYNGPGDDIDMASDLAVDFSGNLYVTGTSKDLNDDFATVKYDPSGSQQWVQRYNGPGDSFDGAAAIATDASGNIFVTGASNGSGSLDDYATIKYNPAGVVQWVARYNGPGNSSDQATAIAIDDAGNCYVTGWSTGSTTYRDYATVKYSSGGAQQWVARYNGPADLDDEAYAIAVDVSGNVHVTGRSLGAGTEQDCATVQYDQQGVEQWVGRYSSPGTGFDEGKAIGVDALGGVYVAGTAFTATYDCLLIKYTPAGVEEWVRLYDGPGGGDDFANGLSVDPEGDAYVTGASTGNGTGKDVFVTRYDQSGAMIWEERYDEWSSPDDAASSIAVESDGTIWLTGTSSFVFNQNIYTTLKYEQDGISDVAGDASMPSRVSLEQNFPNPFNPTTTIVYELPTSSHVRLSVFDILGREMTTLVNDDKPAGRHQVLFNAKTLSSGVYFYRLKARHTDGGHAGDFVATKRLLFLK